MELQVGQRRHLLAQVGEPPHHVEAVQSTLERKVHVDTLEDRGERIEDVEPFPPGKRADVAATPPRTHW